MENKESNVNKVYGYIRVSTKEQSLMRQQKNILRCYPDADIREEKATGTKLDARPAFIKLLKAAKYGDTIVFDSVSRMSRSADEGIEIYKSLYSQGINLVFIKEPYINTAVYDQAKANKIGMTGTDVDSILAGINKYMDKLAENQIRIAFEQAEKEVKDLRQRTKEGMAVAKANGKQIGRTAGTTLETKKAKKAKEIIKKHSRKFYGDLKDSEVMKLANCAKATFYKYCSELEAELKDKNDINYKLRDVLREIARNEAKTT